jgi:hypothetical protein
LVETNANEKNDNRHHHHHDHQGIVFFPTVLENFGTEKKLLYKIFIFKMNNDDDDDNYPGKLLHQAALYLNVDLLKVKFNRIFSLRIVFFFVSIGSSHR